MRSLLFLMLLGCSPSPDWSEAELVEVWQSMGPPGGGVSALYVHEGELLAGTLSGQVFASDDRGQRWHPTAPLPVGYGFDGTQPVIAVGATSAEQWVSTSGVIWRRSGSPWRVEREGTFLPTTTMFTSASQAWFHTAGQAPFRHPVGQAPVQVDSLGPILRLAVDEAVVLAQLPGDSCALHLSSDHGETWTALPEPPACPDLLHVAGEVSWIHSSDPAGTWRWTPDSWEPLPSTPPLVALAGSGPVAITADGEIVLLGAEPRALSGLPSPPLSLATSAEGIWVGTLNQGVLQDSAHGWIQAELPVIGHRIAGHVIVDRALWVGVEGGVQRLVSGEWQDRSGGLPVGVEPVALTDHAEGPVLVTRRNGPFVWTGFGWSPLREGWPMVDDLWVSAAGVATFADGTLVASTRPARDHAQILVGEPGGAWRDITEQTGLFATDGPRIHRVGDAVLIAAVRGWRIAESPDHWRELGPGNFTSSPYPLIRDSTHGPSGTWVVLEGIFAEHPPCERCGPAKLSGPTFPITAEGLSDSTLVQGVVDSRGTVLATTGLPEPGLWRWNGDRWQLLTTLHHAPVGPLIELEGELLTDTLGAGFIALRPE